MDPVQNASNMIGQVLINGRISVNGQPLTMKELSDLHQGLQLLTDAATKFQQAQAITSAKKTKEALSGEPAEVVQDKKK